MTIKSVKRVYFVMAAALTVSGFITVCTLGQTVRRHRTEVRLAAAAIDEEAPLFTVRESRTESSLRRGYTFPPSRSCGSS